MCVCVRACVYALILVDHSQQMCCGHRGRDVTHTCDTMATPRKYVNLSGAHSLAEEVARITEAHADEPDKVALVFDYDRCAARRFARLTTIKARLQTATHRPSKPPLSSACAVAIAPSTLC